MEKTMNVSAFEMLDEQEMMEIDGGKKPTRKQVAKAVRVGASIVAPGAYATYRVAKHLYKLGYSNGYNDTYYR